MKRLRHKDIDAFFKSRGDDEIVGLSSCLFDCPLAEAIKYANPDIDRVSVRPTLIFSSDGGVQRTTASMDRFIALVDQHVIGHGITAREARRYWNNAKNRRGM